MASTPVRRTAASAHRVWACDYSVETASASGWQATGSAASADLRTALDACEATASGSSGTATLRSVEDYTNKYKGEQVEVALFGGEYQEGVLTAYCYVEDVAHIELNGHILVPLQNIASLHCSSRCDAPEDDWPPRGLRDDEHDDGT